MIFPPWIIPGAGVLVLTIVRCVARGKELRARRYASRNCASRRVRAAFGNGRLRDPAGLRGGRLEMRG
jgi:hypothetical protein